jgi:hypothetical protein
MTAEKVTDERCRDRRLQSIADITFSVVVGVLIWPFPAARAMLSPLLHVMGVIITCTVVLFGYYVLSAVLWRRTLGMRLAGLKLELVEAGSSEPIRVMRWGLVSAALSGWYVIAPAQACASAIPERASGVRVGDE